MNLLLVSSLISKNLLSDIKQRTGLYPAYAVQKFYRVLAQGFIKNHVGIEVVSTPPPFTSKKMYVSLKAEKEEDVVFNYMSFVNAPILRHISLFLSAFFRVLFFGLRNRADKAIVCDVLCYSTCLASILAAKLTGVRLVGIVTDLPWLISSDEKISFGKRIFNCFTKWYITRFPYYIFLTEQMNEPINVKKRPYLVIEGFANIDMEKVGNTINNKARPKQFLYAGFLQEKYGLKMMVDAFMSLKELEAKLIIYGTGPYSEELVECTKVDSRIEYRGLADNEEIVSAEIKATVLLNPRPTHEEYTKYSFPSKNIEYMSSGTPILTTQLPGIPAEYAPYIFYFEEETVDEYARVMENVIAQPAEELHSKGLRAKEWILSRKNNVYQCSRILQMINKI